jgi:hypothetical protein
MKRNEPKHFELPHWSRWQIIPQDNGQIVMRRYCTDGDHLFQWVHDRSDRTDSYYWKRLSRRADVERDHDPVNGKLPKTVGKWLRCTVSTEDHEEA